MVEEEKHEFKDDDDDKTSQDIIFHTQIVVWGRQLRKSVSDAYKIEKNFNAEVLYGKKKGINWRDEARTEEVMFPDFMYEMY